MSGKRNAILNLIPQESDESSGVAYQLYGARAQECFGIDTRDLEDGLPTGWKSWEYYANAPVDWKGYSGWFKSERDVDALVAAFSKAGDEAAGG